MHSRLLRAVSRVLLFSAILITPTAALAQWNVFGSPQGNKLAIGTLAKAQSTTDVRLFPLMDFNKKTKADVLAIRKQRALDQPGLLAGEYAPSSEVFGQLIDGRPWWGSQGLLLGAGTDSSIGTAWHSAGICNPFALILADLRTPSYSYSTSRFPTKLDFVKSGYPSRCAADRLVWNPRSSAAVITYNVTGFLARQNSYSLRPVQLSNVELEFQGYNARDFGFNYCAIDSSRSANVTGIQGKIVQIVHYFHCGPSCGIPGGCNNMSPKTPDLENFSISRLPAKCQFHLWKEKPTSTAQIPDFSYLIEFK